MSARELKERGNAHYVRKQYAQAAEWYSKALAADPSAVPVYTNRAAAHFAAGRFEESAADARAAVERDDGWVKGWYRLGLCLERLERFKAAAEALQKVHERGCSSGRGGARMGGGRGVGGEARG